MMRSLVIAPAQMRPQSLRRDRGGAGGAIGRDR